MRIGVFLESIGRPKIRPKELTYYFTGPPFMESKSLDRKRDFNQPRTIIQPVRRGRCLRLFPRPGVSERLRSSDWARAHWSVIASRETNLLFMKSTRSWYGSRMIAGYSRI